MIATPASQQARRFSADQRGRAATRRLLLESACVFLLAVLIATQWASLLAEDHIKVQRVAAVDAARAGVARLQLNIDHALSATTALAALVRQGGGKVANFEAVGAEILTLYPGIGALQLAPDGVVHQVVPRAGNEKALGHNLLADPLRTQEAFLARDTGRLTLAGPFELMQGGLGAVGRLPVFLPHAEGKPTFWGFTVVLIRFPAILDTVGFTDIERQGYRWVLSRTHPDTGQRQVIGSSGADSLLEPSSLAIPVPNGEWTFSFAPVQGWGDAAYHRSAMGLGLAMSLLVSLAYALVRRYSIHLRAKVAQRTQQLKLERQHLGALIESIPDALFFKDGDDRWLIANEPAKQLFQLHAIAWEGKTDAELAELHPAFRDAHLKCAQDDAVAWQGNGMSIFAETMTDETGRERHFETRKIPVFDEHGKRRALVIMGRDITERKQAEEKLRIAATAFDSQQGMAITDANRVILRVNPTFTQITGYSAEEAVGQTPRILASGRHDGDFYAAMAQSLDSKGTWAGEIWNRRKSGEIYPEWLTISSVKDPDGQTTHYVSMFSDISERLSAQAQIETLAFYDLLTQLPNRRLLLDRLDQALHASTRHARKNALLFVDLDHFKNLNDTLSHRQGDQLLTQVAQRLKACSREGDTVARLGSDEFVVMLEDLSEDTHEAANQAEAVGEKMLAVLCQNYPLDGGSHHSTASIGVTLFGSARQESKEEPLKRAELAMFQAKAAGRNTLRFFDAQMQAEVSAHAALEADLREAVQKQQFVLHYQPQVVGPGRVTGVEALVRWQHPVRGMVPPAEFIPLAEETGLILPIGQWVLEAACVQLAAWAKQPELEHLTMAVNVSARQFKQANFVDTVLATVARHQATPKYLKLELTESMMVDDVEAIIATMGALKSQGIGFSLDDFGTGYSSLSYLKRLPLSQLKIDQGFVRNIVTDPNDAAIAKMVVVLAESLGLSVIAEGVELQAQADFLAHLGCHAYQGYLFSRPLPLAAFEAFLREPHERTP